MNSRCWALRRNYLKLYSYFKRNGSHDFNRSLPLYSYKNLLNDKNVHIKL